MSFSFEEVRSLRPEGRTSVLELTPPQGERRFVTFRGFSYYKLSGGEFILATKMDGEGFTQEEWGKIEADNGGFNPHSLVLTVRDSGERWGGSEKHPHKLASVEPSTFDVNAAQVSLPKAK